MSTAEALLSDLTGHGVIVWQENGQLRYRAPAGVMTPDLLTTIREQKPHLLTLLAGNSNSRPSAKVTPFVVTFELDGSRVTCIDRRSTTLEESVKELQLRFQGRVGRLWRQDVEITSEHKQELSR